MDKKIIQSVFEQIVEQFPAHIAIEEGEKQMSYAELNQRANKLAHVLRQRGVEREALAGIFLPAGLEYVIAMLGVLKAGGIFMPLDVETPQKRFDYLLQKTSPALMISNREFSPQLQDRLAAAGFADSLPCLLLAEADDPALPERNLPLTSEPDDGNYLLFTSGSTGTPKGILGCHKGLSHFIHWEIGEFEIDSSVRVSQFAPTTFDVSLRDMFVPLIAGGTLCIPLQTDVTNSRRLLHWLQEKRISLTHCVPSLFRLLTKEIEHLGANAKNILPDLRYILLAGEPLYSSDVIKWRELMGERIELVNIYGPSETTLAKLFYRIRQTPQERGRMIPVGYPIPNTAVLILKDQRLCQIGEIGEIHIKTPFRSKGYYHDPELTRKQFIQNPLQPDQEDIIYATGDSGRYLPERCVELLGRLDNQVKIDGIRIELTEIEQAVLKHAAIDQAVVIAHKTSDHSHHLTCYYIERQPVTEDTLREHLRAWLPENMHPRFFVRMEQFPLNLHGKVDRRALPKPEDLLYEHQRFEAPVTALESQLAAIWSDVLELRRVGVETTFQHLGGDSLKAMRIVSGVYQACGLSIGFQDIFPDATVRALARKIESARQNQTKEETAAPAIQSATDAELAMLATA